MRLNGTLVVDGETKKVDPFQSFSLFERQTGIYDLNNGYIAYWLYLSNGAVIQSWILTPDLTGFGTSAIASVWYSNGVHEMVPVDSGTKAWDRWKSPESGKIYFNKFCLSLGARNARFEVRKLFQETELRPAAGYDGPIISESYVQGEGIWDGQRVTVYGHVEEYSFL